MKTPRSTALVLILLLILALVTTQEVRAERIEYIGFEGFSLTQNSVEKSAENTGSTWVKIASIVVSFPEKKYLAGVTADWEGSVYDGGNNVGVGSYYVKLRVDINGKTIGEASHTVEWNHEKHFLDAFNASEYGDTFTIDIYVQAYGGDSDDTTRAEVHNIYIYSIKDSVSIRSKLTELKYIPPGAEDTSSALILNKTEVFLKQNHTLPEGTVAFWLKWDGTNSIRLSDNIGIDKNGYIYIKSDDGTTYTLEGVTPPVGQYIPLYIGWEKGGEGYIMLNTTLVKLNWHGNMTVSKIGEINNESATLIDEFKLWNTYIPPEQVAYESSTRTYYLILPDNTTIPIEPESTSTQTLLGSLSVTFLDKNYNTINSTTLLPGERVAHVPPNTSYVLLSRDNVERLFFIPGIGPSSWTFPGLSDTQLQIVTLTIYPPKYDTLEIWTVDGKLASRINMTDKTYTAFTAVYGKYYKFVVHSGNYTYSIVEQVRSSTLNLKFPQPDAIYNYIQSQEKLITKKKDDNTVQIIYTSPEPKEVTLLIKMFDNMNKPIYSFNETLTTSGFMRTVIFTDNTSYMTIDIRTPTYSAHRIIQNKIDYSYLIPDYAFPNGLRIGLLGMIGLFLVSRRYRYLAPFSAFTILSIMSYLKIVSVPHDLLILLSIAAGAALVTREEGDEV